MSVGITDLAHSIRKHSSADIEPIPFGHAQQLVAAAFGYKTLAAYQAAQASGYEPPNLDFVRHVVLRYDLLENRAKELGIATPPWQLNALIGIAFAERKPYIKLDGSYAAQSATITSPDSSYSDEFDEDGPPARSISQALADELGLEIHEVGQLVDFVSQELDGSSGEMVYSILLDFTGLATPEVAAKIVQRFGSLQVEVGPNFFENVRDDDWPN